MPKSITQYRVFIGSPGGLAEERKKFRGVLEKCSAHHGSSIDVMFHPIGWEDTIGGAGRPQEQINRDLEQCDYAVFVLHDWWGSPTGSGHTSGTEEEWTLAEKLYKANKIRNIALFFKKVEPGKLSDPGDQLKPVLAFKKKIEDEKRYLFKQYETLDEFVDTLDGHLAGWLKDHGKANSSLSLGDPVITNPAANNATIVVPSFDYWITEAIKNADSDNPDHTAALFCASKALDSATSDIEWATAKNIWGGAKLDLGKLDDSISAFTSIIDKLESSYGEEHRYWSAKALFNKGVVLGALGRSDDEIAVYDDLLDHFGSGTELPLRELVAKALYNKGTKLGTLGRIDEAIAVYDDILIRFGVATEMPLRDPVANALFNKGTMLGTLGHRGEAIVAYDDLLIRFGAATELPLRESVAKALYGKGITLGELDRSDDAIAVYDDILIRFGAATELPLRVLVAKALYNKGTKVCTLGRIDEAIAVYDDILIRFGVSTELPLRESVGEALFNKGLALGLLDRVDDEVAVYDDLLARFGAATELPLRELVAEALYFKGAALGELGRSNYEIAVYNDLLARFGAATELPLRELVAKAQRLKDKLTKPQKKSRKRLKKL